MERIELFEKSNLTNEALLLGHYLVVNWHMSEFLEIWKNIDIERRIMIREMRENTH